MKSNKHLVLDIYGTLLHSEFYPYRVYHTTYKQPDLIHPEFVTFKRPHLDQILDFCFENFATVSLWSAGSPAYVNTIAKFLDRPFTFVKNAKSCTRGVNGELVKNLNKLWHNKKLKRMGMCRRNTIILEDNLATCVMNRGNAMHIIGLNCLNYKCDMELIYVMRNMQYILPCANVRMITLNPSQTQKIEMPYLGCTGVCV